MENIENNINYNFINKITWEDCKIVEQWIKEENKEKGNHMIEKTALEFWEESINDDSVAIKINDEIIGYISVTKLSDNDIKLIERGSLFIKKEYRNNGLGSKLIKHMLEKYGKNNPMYCVTNVEAAKKINEKFGQHKYIKTDIPKEILKIIEIPGKLLENDLVYCNEILHTLMEKKSKFDDNI